MDRGHATLAGFAGAGDSYCRRRGFFSGDQPDILAAARANIATSLLLLFDRQLPFQRYASVGVDLLFACLLFYQTGTIQGNAGWAIILPAMTASLYFGLVGGGVAATLGLFFLGVLSILSVDTLSALLFLVSLIPLCLLVVSVFGFLSSRGLTAIFQ